MAEPATDVVECQPGSERSVIGVACQKGNSDVSTAKRPARGTRQPIASSDSPGGGLTKVRDGESCPSVSRALVLDVSYDPSARLT